MDERATSFRKVPLYQEGDAPGVESPVGEEVDVRGRMRREVTSDEGPSLVEHAKVSSMRLDSLGDFRLGKFLAFARDVHARVLDGPAKADLQRRAMADQFVSSVHRFDARIQHSGPRVNSHTEYLGDGQLPTGHSRKYWTSWEHRRASW